MGDNRLIKRLFNILLKKKNGRRFKEDEQGVCHKMASADTFGLSEDEMKTLQTITDGNNKFAITLYRALSKNTSGNVFVSPLSAQIALALTYTGAKGDTAAEIAKALSLPDNMDDTYCGYNSLIRILENPALKMANRMFVMAAASIKDDFQNKAKKFFFSPAESVNFSGDPDGSRKRINYWVEEQTNKKIVDLLASGTVSIDTRLVLVNAVHFKADWKHKFRYYKTEEKPFFVAKGESVPVQMMHIVDRFGFLYDEELKAKILKLEYEGSQFHMLVVLPDDIEGLEALESRLETVDFAEKVRSMEETTVAVELPKFKVEETMDLNDILKDLGVKSMFDDDKADLSGLSDERLVVSKVVQKVTVEVNEKGTGTEIAAAPGRMRVPLSATEFLTSPLLFTADHPFLFMICHSLTPIFIGRINGEIPSTPEKHILSQCLGF